MKISGILNGVYDEHLGWRPASGSTKPAHLANGICREITGRVSDISPAIVVMFPNRKGKKASVKSPAVLKLKTRALKQHDTAMAHIKDDDVTKAKVRVVLAGLLGSEGSASYAGFDRSSLSVSTGGMVSEDRNDRHIGRFFGALLKGTDLEPLIIQVLSHQKAPEDPLTCAAWPLLDVEGREFGIGGGSGRIDNAAYHAAVNGEASSYRRAFIVAAKNLASHEVTNANRLRILQRTTVLCSFGILSQLQHLSSKGNADARAPLLLSMDVAASALTSKASAASVANCVARFEQFLMEASGERLARGSWICLDPDKDPKTDRTEGLTLPSDLNEMSAEALFRSIDSQSGAAFNTGTNAGTKIIEARLRAFREAVHAHEGKEITPGSIAAIYGMALVRCYLEEYTSGGPQRFLGPFLGKMGILHPRKSGEKRLSAAPDVVDTLTRCCFHQGEHLTRDEFLERLWNLFGIVVGGRSIDMVRLREHGIEIEADALERNTEAFVMRLENRGFAQRYSDGVAFIGDVDA